MNTDKGMKKTRSWLEAVDLNKQEKKAKPIWDEIMDEYNEKRRQTEEYIKSKEPETIELPTDPLVEYFKEKVFPPLNEALTELLRTIIKTQYEIMPEDYSFNALNFLAEHLWNMNALYPNRKLDWSDPIRIWCH